MDRADDCRAGRPDGRSGCTPDLNVPPGEHTRPALVDGGPLPPDDVSEPAVLADVLCRAAVGGRCATRGVTYASDDGSERHQSYGDLLGYAEQMLAGLYEEGLEPGSRVALLLSGHRDFLPAFWASVLGGLVPVPLAVPALRDQSRPSPVSLQDALRVTQPSVVLTNGPAQCTLARADLPEGCRTLAVEGLRGRTGAQHHRARPDDVALLMMTPGGTPRAVMLTHRNLLARTVASQRLNGFTTSDVTLNWMALDDVAGLVEFHLRDVYLGCHQVHLSTKAAVPSPVVWLDALQRYRATVTFASRSGIRRVLDRAGELGDGAWDLSSVRFVISESGPIEDRTLRTFQAALTRHQLSSTALRPAWGMVETSASVTYNASFALRRPGDERSLVEAGAPIPACSVRIVDGDNELVDEGVEGRLQVKGAAVTQGYLGAPLATRESFAPDGWFKTGQRGLIRDAVLTVTGGDGRS